MRSIPFGFHVVDDSGHAVDDSDLSQADLLALAQIDGEDEEDEEEI